MLTLFRLRFLLALSAILMLYGWAGQRDYEDQRAIECASRKIPQGYDPITDTCSITVPGAASTETTAKAR